MRDASAAVARRIRRARPDDIPGMVGIHLLSFPTFFLTFLGPRFLRLMYLETLREPGNVSLVALNDAGEVTGFVVGVRNQEHLYRRLAHRRWWAFAVASIRAVLRNPFVLPRLFRAFKYPEKASHSSCPALLMSIAVAPSAQGMGVGKRLIDEFFQAMAAGGTDMVALVTDRNKNEGANAFYRRCGFSKTREFSTPEGRWMNEYVAQDLAREARKEVAQ